MKRLRKTNPQYWEREGFSPEQSAQKAVEFKGVSSKSNPNHYLYYALVNSFDEAVQAAEDWKEKKCTLKKDNMIKAKFAGDEEKYSEWKRSFSKEILKDCRPSQKEYWTNQGFSEVDALQKCKDFYKKFSKRSVEYWIDMGYSLEDAKQKVAEHQDFTSLEFLIEKFGKDDGEKKYNENSSNRKQISRRSIEYWLKNSSSEEEALKLLSEYQSEIAYNQKVCATYWKKLGYSEDEAKKIAHELGSRRSAWSKHFWMDKGLPEQEAIEKVKQMQKSNAVKARESFLTKDELNRGPTSKIEIELRSKLIEKFGEESVKSHYIVRDVENNKYFFPDFLIHGIFIEFYGTFWHADPRKYSPEKEIFKKVTAADIWKRDEERISKIKQITGKEVYIIWEENVNTNGMEFEIEKFYNKYVTRS